MLLSQFSAPGNLVELSEDVLQAWHERVAELFNDVSDMFPRLYNPAASDTPQDHRVLNVTWPAFPGPLRSLGTSPEDRWEAADADRQKQDEYCEWSVLRDPDGGIRRVTFTSEVPEYFDHLFDLQRNVLLDLYASSVGQTVPVEALHANGIYDSRNPFNTRTDGTIVHLAQITNNLRAALVLAGEATILRRRGDGTPVTSPMDLVKCGRLGDPRRHSDPQIASAVNNLVADGFHITLTDPPGLYIAALETAGMEAPDGADPRDFWVIERGDPNHVVRASFAVPEDEDYRVAEITLDGRPIRFGAQLADRVTVRLSAAAKTGTPPPARVACVSGP